MKRTIVFILLVLVVATIFMSAKWNPKKIKVVQNFDVHRYLGKWYEIARYDFKHEKNMSHVTAYYSMKNAKTIKVENRGYDYTTDEWKESIGKAKFVHRKDEGAIKVSFFGPFYGGYNVVALDEEYQYALVVGNNLKYIWILSRTKTIPEDIKVKYLAIARDMGYDTSKLVWTIQDS